MVNALIQPITLNSYPNRINKINVCLDLYCIIRLTYSNNLKLPVATTDTFSQYNYVQYIPQYANNGQSEAS